MRFTITRAVSGFFGSAIQSASCSRPLPFSSAGSFCPPSTVGNRRGTSGPSRSGSPLICTHAFPTFFLPSVFPSATA